MNKIKKLPGHVANLIAAGEVVERPASVVKELVENAVDAGASSIAVEIQNGGMSLIRVTDDGSGMSREDAVTAFLRHATSKISEESDLGAIRTLGFRGEALAAVAAVSRVELLTREKGALSGVSILIEGGEIVSESEAGCPEGTTIIVRDLFFNTPARMKFMKKNSTEGARAQSETQSAAFCHPEISFRMIRDGEEALSTPGDGELKSVIYCAFGKAAASGLLDASGQSRSAAVSGYVSPPTAVRGTRAMQNFFVNGRPVRSKLLCAALEEAYKNRLGAGRYPACFLNINMDYSIVDVNVHPSKSEVKFAFEREVFEAVYVAVSGALKNDPARVQAAVAAANPESFFSSMTAERYRGKEAQAGFFQTSIPPAKPEGTLYRVGDPHIPSYGAGGASSVSLAGSPKTLQDQPEADGTGRPEARELGDAPVEPPPEERAYPETAPDLGNLRLVGEVFETYIIVQSGAEMLIIDKHAAHERIIFERLKAGSLDLSGQTLLAPSVITLPPGETAAVLNEREYFESLGFDIEDFGGGGLIVRQVPHMVPESDIESLVAELARAAESGRKDGGFMDRALHSVACKAAVRAGDRSAPEELMALVREVLSRDDLKYCPHGRPLVASITAKMMEKFFRR